MRATLALVSVLASLLTSSALAEGTCEPAQAGVTVAEAPEAWRAAVHRLVTTTAKPGHPWSCGGGTVDLQMRGENATLIVVRQGESPVARELTEPDDVVPLGQALLSLPRESLPEPPPKPLAQELTQPMMKPPELPPRLLLAVHLGPRVPGGTPGVLLGGDLEAAVPLGAWLPAVQVSFYRLAFNRRPDLDAFSVRASFARLFALPWLEVRAGLTVAATAMQRDLPRPAGGEVRMDARVGAMAGVAIPLVRRLRLLAGMDGDFAIGRSRDEVAQNPVGESAAPFPYYTLGASVGLEVGL